MKEKRMIDLAAKTDWWPKQVWKDTPEKTESACRQLIIKRGLVIKTKKRYALAPNVSTVKLRGLFLSRTFKKMKGVWRAAHMVHETGHIEDQDHMRLCWYFNYGMRPAWLAISETRAELFSIAYLLWVGAITKNKAREMVADYPDELRENYITPIFIDRQNPGKLKRVVMAAGYRALDL